MKVHTFSPLRPKRVLGIVAHQDDLEFGAGGSIAKWTADGAEVYYLILTDGGKGSADPQMTSERLTEIRNQEQQTAGKVLSIREVSFLGYPDGALEVTMPLKRDIVQRIREVKPDVVITIDPSLLYYAPWGFVNHPDHRAAGQAALDAVYPLARDRLGIPELCDTHEPHKVGTILLMNFERHNFGVDITGTYGKKLKALDAHASQFPKPSAIHKAARRAAEEAGEAYGCGLAEAFMRIDIE